MNYNHTPDTQEVRQHWTDVGFGGDGPSFDRWLTEQLRQAQETAWSQGWIERANNESPSANPYRSQPWAPYESPKTAPA